MMKISLVNLIRVFTITACLSWYQCNADQQSTKDDGVDFGKSLTGGVINDAKYTPPGTVPGFTTTALPETGYYGSQDLGGMQTDAQTMVTTGAGNDAAQFAYEQSTVPKLLFSDTDPLITNAGTAGSNAVLNPDVLTVTTGDCATTNVSSAETNIEHCTAWMIPTAHTCNRTLDVNVTWSDAANCPVGEGFAEVSTLGWDWSSWPTFPQNTSDYIRARAYCNPSLPPDRVEIEVYADGELGSCDSGWVRFQRSTDGVDLTPGYIDADVFPRWGGFSTCHKLLVVAYGQCVSGQCDYTVEFWDENGYYSYMEPMIVQLTFEKPAFVTQIPTVTEAWNDTCGYLEAQVLP